MPTLCRRLKESRPSRRSITRLSESFPIRTRRSGGISSPSVITDLDREAGFSTRWHWSFDCSGTEAGEERLSVAPQMLKPVRLRPYQAFALPHQATLDYYGV